MDINMFWVPLRPAEIHFIVFQKMSPSQGIKPTITKHFNGQKAAPPSSIWID